MIAIGSAPLVAALAVFVGVLALSLAAIALRGDGRGDVRRRLDVHIVRVSVEEARRLERVKVLKGTTYSAIPLVNALLVRFKPAQTARIELWRANLRWRVPSYLLGRLLLALGLGAVIWLAVGPLFSPLGGIVGLLLPRLVVKLLARRRRAAFEAQLAEALDLIVGALRTGYGFLQGLESVAKDMTDPMQAEMTRLLEQVNVGVNLVDALQEMTERIASYDLALFASAIAVNRTAGGNLAEVLENIATTVRERRRIRDEVKAITTGPRVSSYILGLMPLGLLLAFNVINADYRRVMMGTTAGHILIAIAAIWSTLGFVLSRAVVTVEY